MYCVVLGFVSPYWLNQTLLILTATGGIVGTVGTVAPTVAADWFPV